MNEMLIRHIEEELRVKIIKTEQVFGGDINQTFVLHTSERKLFLKLNDITKADMFEKESAGLSALRSPGVMYVPEPVKHGLCGKQIFLVMEHIAKGQPAAGFWKRFADELAALHKTTTGHFGFSHDNYIGSLPQLNKQHSTWSEFYADQRILSMTRLAYDDKRCDTSDIKMAEQLCGKLDTLFPKEAPALLHGDLWSGNYMANDDGYPVIYDPAVYYGHREMDLGMTLLFGGFDDSLYHFYHDAFPLEKDWRKRVDLTQLYPLLVHLNLFGGHYYQRVREVLKKYT